MLEMVPRRLATLTRPSRRPPATDAIPPRDPARLSAMAGEVAIRTFTPDEIRAKQRTIYDATLTLSRVIDGPNFTRVEPSDLSRMIRLYDEHFFGGRLMPLVDAEGVEFAYSKRMTSVAGMMTTRYPAGEHGPRTFKLALSSPLLFQTFRDVDRPIDVTGVRCHDRLEAMQRVAEHELVHLVEMLVWNDGNCNQPRFQSIARRYFGHTDYRHQLITQRERAATKFNIRVGDSVQFEADGRTLRGRVNRITRRATVLVEDPRGRRYSDGGRYAKFYVPLEGLRRVDREGH